MYKFIIVDKCEKNKKSNFLNESEHNGIKWALSYWVQKLGSLKSTLQSSERRFFPNLLWAGT